MNKDTKNQCGICNDGVAKYKCPKCNVMYCSLKCYKDIEKHNHEKNTSMTESDFNGNNAVREDESDQTTKPNSLETKDLNDIYQSTPELKNLLKYNTVKFHLSKVYRILTTDSGGDMTTDNKKHLAIEYLNTLRYGGIHYNEAIEEFCQICIRKLNNQ